MGTHTNTSPRYKSKMNIINAIDYKNQQGAVPADGQKMLTTGLAGLVLGPKEQENSDGVLYNKVIEIKVVPANVAEVVQATVVADCGSFQKQFPRIEFIRHSKGAEFARSRIPYPDHFTEGDAWRWLHDFKVLYSKFKNVSPVEVEEIEDDAPRSNKQEGGGPSGRRAWRSNMQVEEELGGLISKIRSDPPAFAGKTEYRDLMIEILRFFQRTASLTLYTEFVWQKSDNFHAPRMAASSSITNDVLQQTAAEKAAVEDSDNEDASLPECVVCTDRTKLHKLPCNHEFCQTCITKIQSDAVENDADPMPTRRTMMLLPWGVKEGKQTKCPYCREIFSSTFDPEPKSVAPVATGAFAAMTVLFAYLSLKGREPAINKKKAIKNATETATTILKYPAAQDIYP